MQNRYSHAHVLITTVNGGNYYLNSYHTKYLAQFSDRLFTFWNISTANLRVALRNLPT